MKRTPLLIWLLVIIAGIGLAVALVSREGRGTGTPKASARAPAPTAGGAGTLTAGLDGATVTGTQEVQVADAWKALRSDDLKTLIANLRAAGFPPAVVRAVAMAMLQEQYAARRRQIMGDEPPPPYWKAAPALSSTQLAALRQLAREEQDTIKQLLGPDSASAEWTRYMQQRMYGPLPADKIDMLQRIQSDYSDLRQKIFSDAGGPLLPWDRQKLAVLAQEQRADIAAALTPDELRQYDLYSSPTAQRLRNQLTGFNPTEQEFLALYNLQSQFDQQYNSPETMAGGMPPDFFRQRQAAEQQLQAQIKSALGDDRYTAYQQSIDPGFQAANRIVGSLQLPPENAAAAWNVQQSIQQQANTIRSARDVPPPERLQALNALDAQANQQLATLLTQAGADAYKQTPGGNWLRVLDMNARRPPPAPAPAPPPTH